MASQLNIIYNNLFWLHIQLLLWFLMKSWLLCLKLPDVYGQFGAISVFDIINFLRFLKCSLKGVSENQKPQNTISFHHLCHFQHKYGRQSWESNIYLAIEIHSLVCSYICVLGRHLDLIFTRLWDDIIDAMLPIQLKLTFNIFLLNNLCNGFLFGQYFLINFKNVLNIGSYNHWIWWIEPNDFLLHNFFSFVLFSLLLSLAMHLSCSEKPFFRKATWYIDTDCLKTYLFDIWHMFSYWFWQLFQ